MVESFRPQIWECDEFERIGRNWEDGVLKFGVGSKGIECLGREIEAMKKQMDRYEAVGCGIWKDIFPSDYFEGEKETDWLM